MKSCHTAEALLRVCLLFKLGQGDSVNLGIFRAEKTKWSEEPLHGSLGCVKSPRDTVGFLSSRETVAFSDADWRKHSSGECYSSQGLPYGLPFH